MQDFYLSCSVFALLSWSLVMSNAADYFCCRVISEVIKWFFQVMHHFSSGLPGTVHHVYTNLHDFCCIHATHVRTRGQSCEKKTI